jgi:hypothetical protein
MCELLADYHWDVVAPVADYDDLGVFQAAQLGPRDEMSTDASTDGRFWPL